MDFEEFRKQKQAKADAKEKGPKPPEVLANGKPSDWIDGFGPSGPTNPKVKGFMLGRYRKKKVDPSTLERPDNYERTRHNSEANQRNTQAELELERKRAQLAKMQADLEAALEQQREAEVAARRAAEGFGSIKGRQRY